MQHTGLNDKVNNIFGLEIETSASANILGLAAGPGTDDEKNVVFGRLMKGLGDEEKKAYADAQDEAEAATATVMGMVKAAKLITCQLCTGWGHKAQDCHTLKVLNNATKGIPNLKSAWGGIKANYIKNSVKRCVNKGIAGRKRLAKYTYKHKEKIMAIQMDDWNGKDADGDMGI
jgi:hypothetical protein